MLMPPLCKCNWSCIFWFEVICTRKSKVCGSRKSTMYDLKENADGAILKVTYRQVPTIEQSKLC